MRIPQIMTYPFFQLRGDIPQIIEGKIGRIAKAVFAAQFYEQLVKLGSMLYPGVVLKSKDLYWIGFSVAFSLVCSLLGFYRFASPKVVEELELEIKDLTEKSETIKNSVLEIDKKDSIDDQSKEIKEKLESSFYSLQNQIFKKRGQVLDFSQNW